MGNLPPIGVSLRLPLEIPAPVYLSDHLFQGRPVLPAVEAMDAMAREVNRLYPDYDITCISDARFEKFLPIDSQKDYLDAFLDLQLSGTGDLHAALITRTRAPGAAITRTKTHARLIFPGSAPPISPLPLDVAAAPEGICVPIAADRIYRDLVPFGPAYKNLQDPLWLGTDGALGIVCPPLPPSETVSLLGSPFALDAAFHAACVWAQHYHDMVAFPVGIDHRRIFIPTQAGHRYYARILPQTLSADLLMFNIWLFDETGNLCESAQGVHMRDVSGGRLKPPEWISRKRPEDPLADLRARCESLSIVELAAVAPFAEMTLSPLEKARFEKMGAVLRRKSFLAARIALKRLFRRQQGENSQLLPREIETVCADSTKPRCFHKDNPLQLNCSLSHDNRFAVAVLSHGSVGVDVEPVSDKALTSARLFMSEKEQQIVTQSALAPHQAAVRVWSAKEAVSKATGMALADAWQRVQLVEIGEKESRLSMEGKGPFAVAHAPVDDHVVTLFTVAEDHTP